MQQRNISLMLLRWSMFFLTAALVFQSCNPNQQKQPGQLPDSQQQSKLIIHRYEDALFALDKNHLRSGLATLIPEYSFFLGNEWQDTMNILRVYNFLNDKNIVQLYKLTKEKYPDLQPLAGQLHDAFSRFHDAYPEKPVPRVFTYVSGFDIENPVYYYDTAMAIGLDLFLGSDQVVYGEAGFPKYKIDRLTPDHLMPACMLAISDHLVRYDENRNTLLDEMLAAGKALYFLDVTLPETADKFKIGYTDAQLEWAQKHEGDVWAFIIENQLLFSSDPKGISKLITDSPFTSGFGDQSPGRLGVYIGWQIVRAYMENSHDTTLRQLMENVDSQQILKISRYKPAKN